MREWRGSLFPIAARPEPRNPELESRIGAGGVVGAVDVALNLEPELRTPSPEGADSEFRTSMKSRLPGRHGILHSRLALQEAICPVDECLTTRATITTSGVWCRKPESETHRRRWWLAP